MISWKWHDRIEWIIPLIIILTVVGFPLFLALSFCISLLQMVDRIGK